MKKFSIVLISTVMFFISCQTKAKSLESDFNQSINKITNTETNTAKTATPEATQSNKGSNIGNVEVGNKCVRLFIENSQLKIGDLVQIVLTEIPQRTLTAEIEEDKKCEDEPFGNLSGNNLRAELNYYQLKILDNKDSSGGFGIGIVDLSKKVKLSNGVATVDLDEDNKNEYFRECTSYEGLHLTVWKGKPLVGKRIWHSYYDFSYATEPTCKNKDFK